MSQDDEYRYIEIDQDEDGELDAEDFDIAPNEAKVVITLARQEEGIDGFIDTVEGTDFDPGDTEGFSGSDVVRLAAEMVLIAAGYSEEDVQHFLDTAPRGPMPLS